MMVDFGQRVERKQLWSQMDNQHEVMVQKEVPSYIQLTSQVRKYADQMSTIIHSNDYSDKKMASVENVLFRKLTDAAVRQNVVQSLLKKRMMAKLDLVKRGDSLFKRAKSIEQAKETEKNEKGVELSNISDQRLKKIVTHQVQRFVDRVKVEQKQVARSQTVASFSKNLEQQSSQISRNVYFQSALQNNSVSQSQSLIQPFLAHSRSSLQPETLKKQSESHEHLPRLKGVTPSFAACTSSSLYLHELNR